MQDSLCLSTGMIAFPRFRHRIASPVGHRREAISAATACIGCHLRAPRLGLLAIASLALAIGPSPLRAQRVLPADSTTYTRAIAAGYKAAMYCSGIFTAGRTPAQIDADELTGIYPEYDAIVPTLTARIIGTQVSVAFAPAMPPRLAVFRAGRGCVTLPIGTRPAPGDAPRPPRVAGADPRPWPLGDGGIHPPASPASDTAVEHAFDGATYGTGKTTGVVILRDGVIVAERYAAGWGPFTANRTWSVGKSIAGTLIGLARTERDYRGKPPLPLPMTTLQQWRTPDDPRGAITLDHLLRMASGLHTDTAGNRTDAIYFGGTAVEEQAPAWPLEAAPGTRFRYSNTDILLAVLMLRRALGEERYPDYPATALFAPLGMTHTQAGTDWHGNYILSSPNLVHRPRPCPARPVLVAGRRLAAPAPASRGLDALHDDALRAAAGRRARLRRDDVAVRPGARPARRQLRRAGQSRPVCHGHPVGEARHRPPRRRPRRRPLRHREVQRRYPGGDSMNDWDAVVAFALTLPATQLSTSYGQPALKVDGKAFTSTGREPGSFHVRSPHEEKAILLDTDPDTFWQTAHYANWPGLLVRYGSADPERVELVLSRAWWDAAKAPTRKLHGERP